MFTVLTYIPFPPGFTKRNNDNVENILLNHLNLTYPTTKLTRAILRQPHSCNRNCPSTCNICMLRSAIAITANPHLITLKTFKILFHAETHKQ